MHIRQMRTKKKKKKSVAASSQPILPLGLIRHKQTDQNGALNNTQKKNPKQSDWATVAERRVLLWEKPPIHKHRVIRMKLLLQSLNGTPSSISHSQASHFFNFKFCLLNYIYFSGHYRSVARVLGRRYFAASTEEYAKRNYANNASEYDTVVGALTAQRRSPFFFVNRFCWEPKANFYSIW
jgi:hypothetical protein